MSRFKGKSPWMFAVFALAFCLVFSLVLYQAMGMSTASGMGSGSQSEDMLRSITVSGTAEVYTAPDEVDITVGIETRDPEFQKAKASNDEYSARVIKLAGQYGIDSKYVQSDYIRTFPTYDYQQYVETCKVSYYNVQKRIIIKLKDIGKFEDFTSDILKDGNVSVQNVEFHCTGLSKYREDARKLAIKAAKDKAVSLASEIGSGIARVMTINEEQIDNQTWYGSWWGSSWYGYGQPNAAISNVAVNYQNYSAAGGAQDQDDSTISVGQIRITAKIGVVFELK